MCEDVTEVYEFCRHPGKSYVRPCLNGPHCDELVSVDLIIMSFCPCCFQMGMSVDGYGGDVINIDHEKDQVRYACFAAVGGGRLVLSL